jgi:hypothetical protein
MLRTRLESRAEADSREVFDDHRPTPSLYRVCLCSAQNCVFRHFRKVNMELICSSETSGYLRNAQRYSYKPPIRMDAAGF